MKKKKPPLSELKSMTIEELNFILSNLGNSDVNYRKTIADLIESKLEVRKKETTERIRQLNEKIQFKQTFILIDEDEKEILISLG